MQPAADIARRHLGLQTRLAGDPKASIGNTILSTPMISRIGSLFGNQTDVAKKWPPRRPRSAKRRHSLMRPFVRNGASHHIWGDVIPVRADRTFRSARADGQEPDHVTRRRRCRRHRDG